MVQTRLLLGIGLLLATTASAADRFEQEQQIRAVIAEYSHIRNDLRDPEELARFFLDDAEMRSSSTTLTRGRGAIETEFRRVFSGDAARLAAITTVENIQFIDKNTAVVDIMNEWRRSRREASGYTLTTLVMRKDHKKWKIASSRTAPMEGEALRIAKGESHGEGTRARERENEQASDRRQ